MTTSKTSFPRKKVRLRRLTMVLLKADVSDPKDALAPKSRGIEASELRDDLPFQAELYVKAEFSSPLPWVPFLQAATKEVLGVVTGASNSAVLFVRQDGRLFAYVFGRGRHMLARRSWEPDFGLRATLNAVDPERLRSVDVQTVEEVTMNVSKQLSKSSAIGDFGLDVDRDLLRIVIGEPRDPELATRLIGADALGYHARVEVTDLGDKCSEFLAMSARRDYRRTFPWVDHLRGVSDQALVSRLDTELLKAISGPVGSQPHLSPPEPMRWEDIDGFTYTTEPADTEPREDLELDDYLFSLPDKTELSVGRLNDDSVRVHMVEQEQPTMPWGIYDCLVFQVKFGRDLFVLSSGRWFRVAGTFAEQVRNRVEAISETDLSLPEPTKSEKERQYAERAAVDLKGAVLMDRKLTRAEGAQSSIEVCDVFTQNKQFVHIKWWWRSATLSHLFYQGAVSGETFVSDGEFRSSFRSMLTEEKADEIAGTIPEDRPRAEDYEVAYVVIGRTGRAEDLPFFSQLALSQAASRLRGFGFGVTATVVPLSA